MRKISRRSFLKAATVACALTALTACGGGDESAAVSVAKDENGAYVDTLTITLGRFAEPSAAALFPEGQTFEDNAYTRYIESKLNVDLVDSFEAGGDAFTNQLATCVASGELPDIMSVISYDTFVEMVNNGLTYDMTDVYEEYASDYIKSLYDSYDGRCLSMATFDGRLMGIPGTNPDNSVPVLCWMRKDWLDKLGINPDPDGDLCITLDDIAAVQQFQTAQDPDTLFHWLYAVGFMLQIYFDFSAYSDMAIGLGAIFGFTFPENFNYPYCSASITEFWRRWHISLGSWFRDYVYIPLGGSRVGKWKLLRNLLLVWAATGLWHGAAWNFVLWGLFYAVLLIAEKFALLPKLQ